MIRGVVPDARCWGVRRQERRDPYPCDAVAGDYREEWFRGVDVEAPPALVYRWVCQLAVAPYSYDLLDNAGRRSPRTLTPGADDLRVGQPMMTIFRLESFERGRHVTLRMHHDAALLVFGDIALTYAVRPAAAAARLVVKMRVGDPPGPGGALRRRMLRWGDLVMMRKQLLTLKALAERPGQGAWVPPHR